MRGVAGRAHRDGPSVLRYHNVYGPRMPRNTPYAGVASIFRSAAERGEAPLVFEDGAQRRDFIHVEDVARANLAALEAMDGDLRAGAVPGAIRTYNVASGEQRTILDLATALSDASGGPAPMVTGAYRLGDVRHVTADTARIRAELDWSPAVGFTEGISDLSTALLRG